MWWRFNGKKGALEGDYVCNGSLDRMRCWGDLLILGKGSRNDKGNRGKIRELKGKKKSNLRGHSGLQLIHLTEVNSEKWIANCACRMIKSLLTCERGSDVSGFRGKT